VIEQRDATGAVVTVDAPEGEQEDAAGPTVNGVRPRISGLGGELVGVDLTDYPWVARVRPGVEDIDPRGPDAGNDQVPALEESAVVAVDLVAQSTGARVPSEVVQLVAGGGELAPADHRA
jgi:hypothetical protein